ncbi:MAG: GNAT family N-acetyltransferase [Ignavibacteriaceae bacterium]
MVKIMMIRNANKNDIGNIIDIHKNSFSSDHFSAAFNEELLTKYFKKLLSSNKYNYVFFDESNSRLLGYVIAGYNYNLAVNKFIKENIKKLIWVLLKNPKFIIEKLNEIFRRVFSLGNQPSVKCRLYLLAVDNQVKGKGVAKKLINHLEQELIKDGQTVYGLSVRKENKEAINFYNKNGYIIEFEKSRSIYYYKKLIGFENNSLI